MCDLYLVYTYAPNSTLDFLKHVIYNLMMALCGGFMSKYDLKTYLSMIEVLNLTPIDSELKDSLRLHGFFEKMFQKSGKYSKVVAKINHTI